MAENFVENQETNGNSALDWEIFDILCRDELGLSVSLWQHIEMNDLNDLNLFWFSISNAFYILESSVGNWPI